jgi:hypothetical protein
MRRLRRGGFILTRTIGGWAARMGDDVIILRRNPSQHWEARSYHHSRVRVEGPTLRACLRHAQRHASTCLWC